MKKDGAALGNKYKMTGRANSANGIKRMTE